MAAQRHARASGGPRRRQRSRCCCSAPARARGSCSRVGTSRSSRHLLRRRCVHRPSCARRRRQRDRQPRTSRTASTTKRVKPTPAALSPLPDRSPLDEGARTQALRAFAEKKAPELRDCVAEPDRGPPLKLGAAFEIGSDGAVDFVQILGADGSPKDVKRCYANHLKRWRFPEELLRGEEKLLVNFVL